MTVLCPSCSTRYRHEPAGGPLPALAECSRCDERFPLVEGRRNFVLLPKPGAGARARGFDDPTVAAEVSARREAARPVERVATAVHDHQDETALAASRAAAIPAGGGVADVAPRDGASTPEFELPEPTPRRRGSAVLEFVAAVAPPVAGAGLAYSFATRDQLDPVAWSALGGAAGFLVGWVLLLWLRRKD